MNIYVKFPFEIQSNNSRLSGEQLNNRPSRKQLKPSARPVHCTVSSQSVARCFSNRISSSGVVRLSQNFCLDLNSNHIIL